jgi:hypothetical protein
MDVSSELKMVEKQWFWCHPGGFAMMGAEGMFFRLFSALPKNRSFFV